MVNNLISLEAFAWVDGKRQQVAQITHSQNGARLVQGNLKWTESTAQLESFEFKLMIEGGDNPVDVPGPFWPNTYIRPGTLVRDLPEEEVRLHSAPDGGFGLVKVGKLALWLDTRGETAYKPILRPTRDSIEVSFTEHREMILAHGSEVSSGTLYCHEVDSIEQALSYYRSWVSSAYPALGSPRWAKEMVLLETYPELGGFREIQHHLSHFVDLGFTTIYMMPHWLGGYMPLDLVKVDPKFGSQQDLISLVDTAHSLGLKVLFDCVIHGFSPDSPLLRSTPEAFIRNPDGSFARHPIWNSVSTDWASEQYLDHIRKVVRYDCETYHIDGYRVDAASFKGPNWNRIDSYASGSRSPHVMTVMLQTLREYNPDSILLNEVFGPLFYSTSNLAHDNQCEAVPWLMRQMKLGNLNAEDYRKHLWYVWSMLPEGTDRVFYTRNHDTSWFAAFEAYDPMYFAFESIHAFCGVPSVFSGDPKHPPLPGESEWRLYRSIFQARKRLEGPLDLSFPSEIPQVFHGLRGQTPFYVSLGNEPLLVRAEGRYRDVLNQYFVNSKEGLLTVEPFQVLIRESR